MLFDLTQFLTLYLLHLEHDTSKYYLVITSFWWFRNHEKL